MPERLTFSPAWTKSQYKEMLQNLRERNSFVDLSLYSKRVPGIWLRHDVEISCKAAVEMATAEQELGIQSTYFICFRSPFIELEDAIAAASEIRKLGHKIGVHRVWSDRFDFETPEELKLTSEEFRNTTFHAPGIDVISLAHHPLGAPAYQNLSNGVGTYASDSAAILRWGNPLQLVESRGLPMQLLFHPYWWFGEPFTTNVEEDVVKGFLPRYWDLTRARE